ncbi:MAG TPA: YeeE/YedE family protein [Flavobacteriales bacterium]|nr:YeeE/YedE family protein [Flavobacteriales bacterium]HIB76327.1 YeeE/YedE family protein [Flavobacteriales bacterium]HIO15845.1 YeeE/YedE family protein [Flavobacteriales bacterium]
MLQALSDPWPWYFAGPAIGLMVPILLLVLNKSFGVSSSLKHMCAMCSFSSADYFKYEWKKEKWNLLFVLGIFLGAVLVAEYLPTDKLVGISDATVAKLSAMGISDFTGLMPEQIFSFDHISSPATLISVILGGFLVGFGTRYAGGCTSGHAIMGLSQLSLGSLVAVIGFFIGGLLVSWFVLPLILATL